jgi:hypothetical protein
VDICTCQQPSAFQNLISSFHHGEQVSPMKLSSNSGVANSVLEQLYSNGTAIYGRTKNELGGTNRGFGILLFVIMESILVQFNTISVMHGGINKNQPKAPSKSTQDLLSPIDECPGERSSITKPLGIMMEELWEVVLIGKCNLAKQMGKRGDVIDEEDIKHFITNNRLDDMAALDKKGNKRVL